MQCPVEQQAFGDAADKSAPHSPVRSRKHRSWPTWTPGACPARVMTDLKHIEMSRALSSSFRGSNEACRSIIMYLHRGWGRMRSRPSAANSSCMAHGRLYRRPKPEFLQVL